VAIRASDENTHQSILHRIRAFFDSPTERAI
jgi:hypothetical protein